LALIHNGRRVDGGESIGGEVKTEHQGIEESDKSVYSGIR
jgi:hypothetical protein